MAILSFLFNWPSTGGGIVHIVELGKFLEQAGYEVRHIHARYEPWGIGLVQAPLPIANEAIEFDEASWNVPTIQSRFREAVDAFGPDWVIIMAAWNFKPLLAEAVRGYSYFLRFQALECLCPLNNLRLLPEGNGRFSQCPRHQLATPAFCYQCLAQNGHLSGGLHQAERHLSGVGSPEYDQMLRQALWEAEAVLVLNPLTEAMLSPFARRVEVVPWGMDPARFPEPEQPPEYSPKLLTTLLFAGLTDELIKGFHVLREACRLLWQKRRDFELVATAEPTGETDGFTRYVGWATQEELPRHYAESDIVVVPTIAQDGLSRTSVEAMASGRPVVGSRIGGVPFTVVDGGTGLLFEPGNAADLAAKLETLLDDADLRRRMGALGHRRFEEHFTWESVIERYYRPLLNVAATM